jgi:hypothetical protein
MKISHSRVELYSENPKKYYLKYILKLEVDKTFTPLLFGSAIDKALNYMLTRTKHKHKVHSETALGIFLKNMDKWSGQNELLYYKNEMPDNIDSLSETDEERQFAVWKHLCIIGSTILSTYKKEILPLFKEVLSVQTKKEIPNEDGDILVLVTDFTAKLQDDRIVVFDNKTTSDIKKNYGPKSVAKSQQLAIYSEFEKSSLAGYIALSKKLKEGKVQWTMVVDEIPEEQRVKAFEKIDKALKGIKNQEFPECPRNCFSYGKSCEYKNYCKNGDTTGIVQRGEKK